MRDGEIGLRVLFRDPNGDETVLQPMHRIGKPRGKLVRWGKGGMVMGRGSFVGSRSGMLELLFDNQDALIRSKQVYMRLGTRDDVDGGEEEGKEQEQEEGEKEEGEDNKVEDTNAPAEVKNE